MAISESQQVSALRIGVDARCLNVSHIRGMGKYLYEVMLHLESAGGLAWVAFGDRPDVGMHFPRRADVREEIFAVRGYRFHAWEQLGLPSRARARAVDVLHCAGTFLPLWQPVPTVVTLHDTLPWQQNDLGRYETWYLNQLIPSALERCDTVITISESSRRDILQSWPSLEPKIRVIPHGISERYMSDRASTHSEEVGAVLGAGAYLLYVGGSEPRKRLEWAVAVLAQVEEPGLRLVACGFGHDEARQARDSLPFGIREHVVFLPFVDEQDMPALYRGAVAVLYPTEYEGFGFPALEAQAVGTPVLFSPVGSLAELAGPGAELLPPFDLQAWSATVRRLLAERFASPVPNVRARAWARKFSWSECARRHLELYEQAAVRGRRGRGDRGRKSATGNSS